MKKCDTLSALLFFSEKSLFYFSETPLFPTPAFPADPPDPPDPADPPDPSKMVPELARIKRDTEYNYILQHSHVCALLNKRLIKKYTSVDPKH